MNRPSKIVCVGRNYADHAKELGNDVPKEPLIFLKAVSSLISSGDTIRLPKYSKHVEYEGEIGVILNRKLTRAREIEAAGAVGMIVAVNDVTARDLQKAEPQWTRAKSSDTFCPMGEPAATPIPFDELTVVTRVNGKERQRGTGSQMVFGIPAILAYISKFMTLEPGDLVLTGTPAGVGPLAAGDEVEVEVVGVSKVTNRVAAMGEEARA